MQLTTIRKDGQLDYPAIVKLCEIAGIDPDEPLRIFTEAGCAGELGEHFSKLPTDGLVQWQHEEGDEIWRDGKVIISTCGARFYVEVYVVRASDGKVLHMVMSNDSQHLGMRNEDRSPPCEDCLNDNHADELVTDVVSDSYFPMWV